MVPGQLPETASLSLHKMKFTGKDFEQLLDLQVGPAARNEIDSLELEYSFLSREEEIDAVMTIVQELFRDNLVFASKEREPAWEQGWGENLREYSKSQKVESLLPKYFGRSQINRLGQRFIRGSTPDFEVKILRCLQSWLFEEYLSSFESVYEFGCGTGHNLLFLRKFNSSANLTGLDWVESSQSLISLVSEKTEDPKLTGAKFNYFEPDTSFKLTPGSAVLTVASLEQIGSEFRPFLDYLMENQPKLVVHIEPFQDLLDPYNFMDNLSIQYMRKRKYISGYCEAVLELEYQGKARVHLYRRSFIGSHFLDGYTILIWSAV